MKTSSKLKIFGFSMVAVGVTLVILSCTVLAVDFAGGWMPQLGAIVPGCFITFMAIPVLFVGFIPNMTRANARLQNEALDRAGKDMGDAMSKTADIASDAITKMTQSVKVGLEDERIFCKHCGKQIAADSAFCKFCGGKQD